MNKLIHYAYSFLTISTIVAAIQSHFTDPFFLRIVRHLPSASLEKVVLSHFKTLNQLSGDKGDILISLLEFANAYIKFNSTSKQLKSLVDERNEVNLECHQLFRDGLSFANIERKGWSERDIKKVLDKIVNDRKVWVKVFFLSLVQVPHFVFCVHSEIFNMIIYKILRENETTRDTLREQNNKKTNYFGNHWIPVFGQVEEAVGAAV